MPRLIKPALPALLVLALLSLAPPALRAENEVYGGVGIGYSTFQIDAVDFEGASRSTRQFLGLNYGDYLGVEFGYIDFGTVNDRIALEFGQPSLNDGVKTWGYDLSLIGRYPLDDELAAFGKAGILRWDSEATIESFPLPTKLDGDDMIWGFGLDYRGSARIHVRVEADFVSIDFADAWWVLTASVMYGIPFEF